MGLSRGFFSREILEARAGTTDWDAIFVLNLEGGTLDLSLSESMRGIMEVAGHWTGQGVGKFRGFCLGEEYALGQGGASLKLVAPYRCV